MNGGGRCGRTRFQFVASTEKVPAHPLAVPGRGEATVTAGLLTCGSSLRTAFPDF
jgi:hypothetical protein